LASSCLIMISLFYASPEDIENASCPILSLGGGRIKNSSFVY